MPPILYAVPSSVCLCPDIGTSRVMLSFRNRRRPGFGTRGNPARAARLGPAGCWFLPSGAEPTILCFPRPAPRVDRAPSRLTLICALGRYADVFLDWHLANLPSSDPGLGMIKSELIKRIASQNSHLYQRDIENIVPDVDHEERRGETSGPKRIRQMGEKAPQQSRHDGGFLFFRY